MTQDVCLPALPEPTPDSLADDAAARWEALWAHRTDLLHIAERRCPSPADAPDVVQEAILRAAAKSDLRVSEAGAWMTRVVVNLCVDLHRRPRHFDLEHLSELPSQRVECCSPELQLDAAGDVAAVVQRFARLPPRQQEAVRLKASELSVTEVAERMGLPYKTVESLLSRARKHLRVGLLGLGAVIGVRRALGLAGAQPGVVVAVGAGLVGSVLAASSPPAGASLGNVERVQQTARVDLVAPAPGAVAVVRPEWPLVSQRPPSTDAGVASDPAPRVHGSRVAAGRVVGLLPPAVIARPVVGAAAPRHAAPPPTHAPAREGKDPTLSSAAD